MLSSTAMIQTRSARDVFSDSIRPAKLAALAKCRAALLTDEPTKCYHIPGRIEVLGKHTDYCGGKSLVAATENGFLLAVTPRADRTMRLINIDTADTIEFPLDPDLQPIAGTWANYPMTVARRAARNFPGPLRGLDIAFSSDLPQAAGLSSSSAMIVAIFLALADVNDLYARDEFRRNIKSLEDLAGYLGTNENGQTFGDLAGDRGVGTFGGSQDHTAILCCEPGKLSLFQYCPVKKLQAVPMPANYVFAIGSCGVLAEKTGAAMDQYNRASRLVSDLLTKWRQKTGQTHTTLNAALRSSQLAFQQLSETAKDDAAMNSRLLHFVTENDAVIPRAIEALERGDLTGFGEQVDRSQHAAETLLGNQIVETQFLQRAARQCDAAAASAFGAGFGGSVWAMVHADALQEFLERWQAEYTSHFPDQSRNAKFFSTLSGTPACRLTE